MYHTETIVITSEILFGFPFFVHPVFLELRQRWLWAKNVATRGAWIHIRFSVCQHSNQCNIAFTICAAMSAESCQNEKKMKAITEISQHKLYFKLWQHSVQLLG